MILGGGWGGRSQPSASMTSRWSGSGAVYLANTSSRPSVVGNPEIAALADAKLTMRDGRPVPELTTADTGGAR